MPTETTRTLVSSRSFRRLASTIKPWVWLLAAVCAACGQDEPEPQGPLIIFEAIDGGGESTKATAVDETASADAVPAEASEPEAAEGQAAPEHEADPGGADEADEDDEDPAQDDDTEAQQDKGGPQGVAATAQAKNLDELLDDGIPRLAATQIATTVYNKPHTISSRLGYVRLGGVVRRDPSPVAGNGCKGKWYRVYPSGYVCTEEATIDMNDPLVQATRVRPALDKPLPYAYGFVRATAPQYLRIPNKAEQLKSEFKLEEHLQWYAEHRADVQRVMLGANDIPTDEQGFARLGVSAPAGFRLSSQLSTTELLGGSSPQGSIPFWLDGGRQIPNVSGFEVPEYAVFADRVRRKTGLSFVDAFIAKDEDIQRRFAVTVDMRLIPATKVKPDTGSAFHGVEVGGQVRMPFAFVQKRGSTTWKLIKGQDNAAPDAAVPHRALMPLSGRARFKAGQRFYQLSRDPKRWLRAEDVGVVAPPKEWPEEANTGEKWIDISLVQQTLVLYVGKQPVYATLVSTGRDRLGDPEKSLATPQGSFRIQSKHIAAAMDSEENSNVSGGSKKGRRLRLSAEAQATVTRVLAAEKAGKKLDDQDRRRLLNIKKGRHPEYGVTLRRGFGDYELRDVPWIQYFESGYALHGAYWHDVFGTPRSHGCVNLAPIDARIVFNWTEPTVPPGWHGLNEGGGFGEGTRVVVRE